MEDLQKLVHLFPRCTVILGNRSFYFLLFSYHYFLHFFFIFLFFFIFFYFYFILFALFLILVYLGGLLIKSLLFWSFVTLCKCREVGFRRLVSIGLKIGWRFWLVFFFFFFSFLFPFLLLLFPFNSPKNTKFISSFSPSRSPSPSFQDTYFKAELEFMKNPPKRDYSLKILQVPFKKFISSPDVVVKEMYALLGVEYEVSERGRETGGGEERGEKA